MTRRRLLVVGASGLVGTEVMKAATSWTALGVARKVTGLATEVLDLLDPTALAELVGRVQPDAVVVASAWPWVDGCEQDPERSERENVQTVKNLVAALPASTRIVFFSTEHVFDGQAPSYDEAAATHPLSVYARHKRDVEALLLARGHALIARTSYVFGFEARRKNFMYRVIDASEQHTPLKVPSAQAGMPTWSSWLARSALSLLDRGFTGLTHLTGPDVLTKAEWAALLAKGLALPGVEIVEVPWQESGQLAPRPERVRLVSTRHDLHHPPLLELLTRERATLLQKVN
jgi:dTDP-4-dehydrorhamnose reductase